VKDYLKRSKEGSKEEEGSKEGAKECLKEVIKLCSTIYQYPPCKSYYLFCSILDHVQLRAAKY
jgi:hypothetical protein